MGRSSHHSTSKAGRRRSHLALKRRQVSVCTQCKNPKLPHRACPNCGNK